MNPLTYIMIHLAIIWLIQTGAIRVNAGLLTQGAVVALYNYMSQILVELVKLANLIINITKSVACGNRIQSVFEIHSTLSDGSRTAVPCGAENAVEFRHVELCYQNAGSSSLSEVNFSVRR